MKQDVLPPYKTNVLPEPPVFRKMVGPSLILLGLGLGSGEVILWPYLAANFGLGIIWAALVGITFQFFLNMEVERYALIRGESVFAGFTRMWRFLPYWFIVSTFIGFGWPGIVASSAKIISPVFGIERFDLLAIAFLVLIGLILSFGPVLYKTVETFQKFVIIIGIPVVVILAFILADKADWSSLVSGIIGRGDGFSFIPQGIPLFTFLGALAYAGAGGNLNLAQSFYVKEKGYGMGAYAGRINSVLTGKEEEIDLTGTTFEVNEKSLSTFKKWWRMTNLEHGIVFWGLGLFTISMLALLSYATVYGEGGNLKGIDFIVGEGKAIGSVLGTTIGSVFLLIAGLMLFGTQFTVLDSTSRIITENYVLAKPTKERVRRIPKTYYVVLWLQLLFGIAVFLVGFTEPRTLVTLGAVFNALAMFISFFLIFVLNHKILPKELRASMLRKTIIIVAFAFFGYFASYAFLQAFGVIS